MKYNIHIIPEPLVKFRIRDNKANTSARSITTVKRLEWEHRKIMDNFLQIDTFDMLYKIFPDSEKIYGSDEDPALVPFVTAMIALDTMNKSRVAQSFAIDTIGNMMADPRIADSLDNNFNFKYIDFINMTGKYDQFYVEKLKILKNLAKHPLKTAFKNLFSK